MKDNRRNISEEDFQRYLENKMTPEERNLFEKELQKNPFEAEAMEGFETVPYLNLSADLKEIRDKFENRKKKNIYRYLAVAATVLLLITAGVIWIQVSNTFTTPELAQKQSLEKKDAIPEKLEPGEFVEEERITETPEVETIIENKMEVADKPALKAFTEPSDATSESKISVTRTALKSGNQVLMRASRGKDNNNQKSQILTSDIDTNSTIFNIDGVADKTQMTQIPDFRIVRGKVVSSADSLPLPGVSIYEKGTTKGTIADMKGNFEMKLAYDSNLTLVASFVGMETTEFIPGMDSSILISLTPSQLTLDDVVSVGYGKVNKTTDNRGKSILGRGRSSVPESNTSRGAKPDLKEKDSNQVFIYSKETSAKDSLEIDSVARPYIGMDNFRKYLKNEAVLPSEYARNKVKVRILLEINSSGKITGIKNQNNADSLLFEKAKEIITKGSTWLPEIEDGKTVDSEIKIKIVFKK